MLHKMNVNSTLRSYSYKGTHACPKFNAHPQDLGIPLESTELLKMSII